MGKDSHEKKKSSETIKENAKGRGESLEKKKKKGKMLAFLFISDAVSVFNLCHRAGELAGAFCAMAGKREDPGIPDPKRSSPGTICIGKIWKKQDDDTANPVLKEGAAVYLKEGKVLFFKIREEKKQTD